MERLDNDFLEKLILKSLMIDKGFLVTISSTYEPEYFDNPHIRKTFKFCKDYVNEYKEIPERDVIINSMEENARDGARRTMEEVDSIEFDLSRNKDYMMEQSNIFLKEQAIKRAILESIDIIEGNGEINTIRTKIEKALCKDLKVNLGLDYFGKLSERLRRIFTSSDIRVPTYFPQFDEYISGGFPPFTLSVMVAKIHGWKCVSGKTKITIKDTVSNTVIDTRIQDFFDSFDTLYKYNQKKENKTMLGLEGMIKKYGEKEGTERYNKWKENVGKSSKNRNTLSFFIERYGKEEGTKRHIKYIEKQKKSGTKEGYIERYGEEEGNKRWNESCKKKGYSNTIDFFVERYGKEEGTKLFYKRQEDWQNTMKSKPQEEIDRINKKKSRSIENYIKQYGKEEGIKRYIKHSEKKSKKLRRIDVEDIKKYNTYSGKVRRISNQQIKIYGLKDNEKRGKDYHLDHKISICYGFNNNIKPEIIGSIYNLEIIKSSKNCSKQDKCSISVDTLFERIENEHS